MYTELEVMHAALLVHSLSMHDLLEKEIIPLFRIYLFTTAAKIICTTRTRNRQHAKFDDWWRNQKNISKNRKRHQGSPKEFLIKKKFMSAKKPVPLFVSFGLLDKDF